MAYIGNNLTVQQYAPTISYLSGNGSTTAFTLPIAVVSAAQIIVTVENVIQNPSTAFSVSGTTLTFTSAPPSGTNNIWVEYTSLQTNLIQPAAGTVTPASLSVPNALYWDTSSNVGVGTTSPSTYGKFAIAGSSGTFNAIGIKNNATGNVTYGGSYTQAIFSSDNASATIVQVGGSGYLYGGAGSFNIVNSSNAPITFQTNNLERTRIHASGGVSVGNTTDPGATNLSVTGTAGCSYFAQDVTLTDSTARTYTANTIYTMPGNIPILGGGADTYLISIIIQYDNVGYHNWTGSCVISLTYWNAYGNSSQWSTQMSTHVNGNPIVTIYDLTGSGSRSIGFSLNSSLTVTSGGFVKITAKRIMTF